MDLEKPPLLLKLSGECLKADDGGTVDGHKVFSLCAQIHKAVLAGQRTALVVGGGNIVRGRDLKAFSHFPTRGDYMGMMATIINALALKTGIEENGGRAEVVAPHAIPNVAKAYDRAQVHAWLADGVVVVFGGGTGHPFFSTDTCAALRAAEIGAAAVLKASNVDGIYNADPRTNPDATMFEHLTIDQAIEGRYGVMDMAAFTICREQNIAIRVFNMDREGAITAALGPTPPGTLVSAKG